MKSILSILLLLPFLNFAQHSVSGTFLPAENYTYALLYQSKPSGTEYLDRSKIGEAGDFKIEMDSSYTPGMYKIVYALPAEEYNFSFIYDGKENIAITLSEDQGLAFTESSENKLWSSYTNSINLVNRSINNFYTQQSSDQKALTAIFKTLGNTQDSFEQAANGMLVSVFIKANRPYAPKEYQNLSSYSQNVKRSYLDAVDFGDPLLQSSDFLMDRVITYIFGSSEANSTAQFKTDVATLVAKIGTNNPIIKTILLETIWRKFKLMDSVEMANYVSDTYLMALAKNANYTALIEELKVDKSTALGSMAPNFDIEYLKDGKAVKTNLYDLAGAENYLLIFWSSTCGHCQEELPKIKELLSNKPNVNVIAIGLEDDDVIWKNAIKQFPEFIQVLGLGRWDNPISNDYGIASTPTYFLLNHKKEIIAKPYDVEALKAELE
ncbi:TlpA family protein disulfide reductase [Subsaximicrobium wynnwilliamsii]|uniref:TlpA family protein disulfide reductase n=1 Tax=Subsaximicrobium wynnwilliamsii TaxID=291179 RepID=A0A5C6ZH29_9FLAO|nr:TlpA disulfide reductase family protein [Subsaximicrobium wynnwilliamsii]TXD83671.1 TlpA family protein disulfide reductase [Subsaximicrobium wynnwilliamsii]TXD89445.1 TlpA family protein disulfide reductase [Subsaximicrobium wynnwilliamsii]TXE03508.1 TlpA family protein disulfide reductase [Subsaximicrobium wynnwilliamsii]